MEGSETCNRRRRPKLIGRARIAIESSPVAEDRRSSGSAPNSEQQTPAGGRRHDAIAGHVSPSDPHANSQSAARRELAVAANYYQ